MIGFLLPSYTIAALLCVSLLEKIGMHQPNAGIGAALLALPLSIVFSCVSQQLLDGITDRIPRAAVFRPRPTAWDNVEDAFLPEDVRG
jgi:hypothetical protein